jgi:hypothetical protein
MKKFVPILMIFFFAGCATALKPNFPEQANKHLGISPVVYQRADWIQGVYGYPTFAEALSSKMSILRGALVCSDDNVVFVRFNKQADKYVSIFELSYPEIADVAIVKKGAGRRLVLHEKKNIYTLEIVKGAMIDKKNTVIFYNFIAQKIGRPLVPEENGPEEKAD